MLVTRLKFLLIKPYSVFTCSHIYFHTTFRLYKTSPPWNILFFGTDHFSNYSLSVLNRELERHSAIAKLEVVTNLNGHSNPVRKFSEEKQLKVHGWPLTLSENEFHIGLVVSFGHLIPENLIKQFPLGMLNVHASLLPRWRGAAPIIHAIANGDSETGITVMRIEPNHFDVGGILCQIKEKIDPDIKMPELHEKLGKIGAEELLNVVRKLPDCLKNFVPQSQEGVTYAPKVGPQFGQIHWSRMTSRQIYNLERALTDVYSLTSTWSNIPVKLHHIQCSECNFEDIDKVKPGFVIYDKKSKTLKVLCADHHWISVKEIGVLGKKSMNASDFNNGYIKKVEINNRYFR